LPVLSHEVQSFVALSPDRFDDDGGLEQDAVPLSNRQWFKRLVRLATAHLDDVVGMW
jgi:hypothetical protein